LTVTFVNTAFPKLWPGFPASGFAAGACPGLDPGQVRDRRRNDGVAICRRMIGDAAPH